MVIYRIDPRNERFLVIRNGDEIAAFQFVKDAIKYAEDCQIADGFNDSMDRRQEQFMMSAIRERVK